MKKTKRLTLLLIITLLALTNCAPVPAASVQNQTQKLLPINLIAQTDELNIYRFVDGARVCYLTESRYSHVASGISCP